MTAPDLQHDISVCFDSLNAPRDRIDFGSGSMPLAVRVLRRTDDQALRSVIADLPAGWRVTGTGSTGHVQGYVLDGTASLDGRALPSGGFFVQHGGTGLRNLTTQGGAQLLLIFDGAPDFSAKVPTAPVVFLANALEVEAITPVVNGLSKEGFSRRVLWKDAANGADTRLLQVARFEGMGPSWHPVHEEIFCLSGDIGPDDRRLMKPGWNQHNPAFGIPGYREHSHGGATILEWHDGEWSMNPA